MGSKGIYTQFERAANKFNTLKFVDCADLDHFSRTYIKISRDNQDIYERHSGAVIIIRKEEFVSRSVKAIEIYDSNKYANLDEFIKINYLIDIDVFNPWNF
jgi:hypothetical protein